MTMAGGRRGPRTWEDIHRCIHTSVWVLRKASKDFWQMRRFLNLNSVDHNLAARIQRSSAKLGEKLFTWKTVQEECNLCTKTFSRIEFLEALLQTTKPRELRFCGVCIQPPAENHVHQPGQSLVAPVQAIVLGLQATLKMEPSAVVKFGNLYPVLTDAQPNVVPFCPRGCFRRYAACDLCWEYDSVAVKMPRMEELQCAINLPHMWLSCKMHHLSLSFPYHVSLWLVLVWPFFSPRIYRGSLLHPSQMILKRHRPGKFTHSSCSWTSLLDTQRQKIGMVTVVAACCSLRFFANKNAFFQLKWSLRFSYITMNRCAKDHHDR